MSENTIVQDGANLPVGWNDLSALDQSVFYPADMSALPTSTPNPAKLRRKSRRSWFEATPKGFKFDIAVEKPEVKKPRPKSETVEVLTLTHFTAAPRLGFGTMKVGQERTCTLLLRNPHDYEQSVKLEKVPEKKNFSVPCKEFTVGPEESYPLEITWCPKEAGGCREMVLMQIDNAYRLQAYVFGTVTAPPPQKKKGKRVGLLGSKVARPFSVIHTTSLANINHDYSPEKKTGTQSTKQTNLKVKKPGTQSKGPVLQTQSRAKIGTVTKARKSDEVKARRRSARLSGKFENDTKENSENIGPGTESKRQSGSLEKEGRKSNERKAVLKREDKNQRKKMRRSNTYSNVSGAGLPVPIIQGETVKGLKDTSMINDCNISGIEMLPNPADAVNVDVEEICKSSVDVPLGLAPKLQGEVVTKNYDSEPSFLENPCQNTVKGGVTDEPSFLEVHDQYVAQPVGIDEPSFLQDHITSVQTNYENLEPSFLEHIGENMGKNPILTGLQNIEKYSDSLEPENQSLEDPSFLHLQPDTKKPNKPRRSLRKRSGIQGLDEENQPTGVKLLRSAKRNKARSTEVSPESFLKENKIKNVPELEPSNEHKPLNDSVSQSSILEQLKHLKSFVHDKSLEIEKSGGESFHEVDANVEELQRRETFVKQNISRFSMPGTEANIRRGTFVTGPSKIKIIETQQPSEASPRRTTFTVVKKAELNKQVRHKVDVTVNVVLEEDENSTEEIEDKVDSNVDNSSKMSEEQCTLLENKGRIFSQDSLENGSFEKQTKSPQQIFSENIEVFTRRSTLTVTKSRPSDALLEHAQRSGATCLFKSENAITSIPEDVRGDVEPDMNKSNTPLHKSSQNSTFEVPLEDSIIVRNSSFPSTPHSLLPNSPLLNDSKRSTHIIEKPKIVDLSKIGTKQLFIKDEQTYEKSEADEEEIIHDTEQSDNIDKEDEVVIASPPSANTRRRLSARRSVTKLRQSREMAEEVTANQELAEAQSGKYSQPRKSTIYDKAVVASEETTEDEPLDETEAVSKTSGRNESESTDEAGQLFFIPIDTKPLSEAPTRPLVQRPNPNQFLKKRSNPITQEVDRRCKRTKSDSVALDLQPCEQKTFVSRQAPTKPSRVTRQTIKSTGSVNDVSRRQVLKPKAGVAKGLAQSKLILSKKSKSAVPRLPLAFAAKNMFYDERWMEKQERGFVNWLNFILTPADEHQSSDVKVKVDAGKLTLDVEKGRNRLAPTNEILSFRTYSAQRKLNRLRKSACRLFQSDPVRRVMQKLEGEVESNRLLVRKDKMLHADLGAKQKILDMLLSYNPLWLRVGLETIYGEMVPLQSNNDVYGLSRFIILRLLASPDIADEYAHPTVPHLYRDGYAQASAQYTLKKFLMLVYFLDQAKQNRLIDHNPCLFCKDSDLKATKDFLLQFSRDFLSGEGDITKHLGYLGYKVTYSQTALDEFDFAVQKLAVDLRDGIRLTRVLEILCSRPDLGKTLRAPAISRLQKIHNVELVFKELTKQKIDPGTVSSRDVVDGHREKTLSLLWTIILQYQVAMVINLEQLKEEIQILERSLRLRNKFDKLINLDNGISTRRESTDKDLHTQEERLNLLLKWCRAVCAFSNIKIENFTVSFSDGRALCHILHYYHPGLVPLTDIQHETTMTHVESMENKCLQNQNCSLNDSVNSSAVFGEMEDPAVYEKLLANEKENFKLLSEKVKELGGVPMMLRWSDMSNTIPDEKVVVTYLMYLCARLLDIRHESRAARVIQHAWKSYRLRKMQAELKEKSRVIVVLQRAVRVFLSRRREMKQQSAAVTVQKYWRGRCARKSVDRLRQDRIMEQQLHAVKLVQVAVMRYLHRRRFLQMRTAVTQLQAYCRGYLLRKKLFCAATCIQRTYRGYRARKHVKQMTDAAVTIQAGFRGYQVRKNVKKECDAARTLQERFRAYLEMKKQRSVFETMKKSCMTIQNAWRGHVLRKVLKEKEASTKIQACWKGYVARKHYNITKSSAIHIQALVRGFLQRLKFVKCIKASVVIQRRFREYLVAKQCREDFFKLRNAAVFVQCQRRMVVRRREFCRLVTCAVKVQSYCRMVTQRRKFLKMQGAASTIQKFFKAYQETKTCRKDFVITKGAAMTIQAVFRGHLVRKEIRRQVTAAVVVQTGVRMFVARRRFLAIKSATLVCQSRFRAKLAGRQQRDKYLMMSNAAMVIQKSFRAYLCRKSFLKSKDNIVRVQSLVRTFLCRRRFIRSKHAAHVVQKRYRAKCLGESCRKEYLITVGACITLQAWVRGLTCRRQYKKLRESVISLQAVVRGHLQQKQYQTLRMSTIKIQRRFREYLVARQQRVEFMQMREAATKIQAITRMHQTRQLYTQKRNAVIFLQSRVRGTQQRKCFLKVKHAVRVLEKYFHAKRLTDECRKQFLVSKGAAMTIQAYFRGHQVRQEMRERQQAAVSLQAVVRGHLQQKQYQTLRTSAIKIQRRFREYLVARQQRVEFMQMREAATKIQAFSRMHQTRQLYTKKRNAVIFLQSRVRGTQQRKCFLKMKHAVRVLEKYFHAKRLTDECRKQFLVSKGAAMTIQAYFRGHQIRQEMRERQQAAGRIQAAFRGYMQKKNFCKLKYAVVVCQRKYRSNVIARNVQAEYVCVRQSAVTLQSAFRGHRARKQYRAMLGNIIKLQAAVRGFLQFRRYRAIQQSVITLQRRVRETLASRQQRQEFLRQRRAAIVIQSMWRMRLATWQFAGIRQAAVVVQANVRCYLQHKKYVRLRSATVSIQRHLRASIVSRQCRQEFLISKGAAMTIQAWYKGCQARRKFREQKSAAVLIQSWSRGFIQRQKFVSLKNAAVVFQRHYRAKLIGRKLQGQFEHAKTSVIRLQAGVRKYLCRKAYLQTMRSIVTLQAACKMYLMRKRFQQQREAAISIQQWYRSCLLTRISRQSFLVQKGAAITIQAYIKMFLIRKFYLKTVETRRNEAVVKIQSCVRGYLDRRRFSRVRNAAVACQRFYRAKCLAIRERHNFISIKKSAIVLQTHFRRLHHERKFQKCKHSVVLIQSWYKAIRARRHFLTCVKAAKTLQTYWRAELQCRQEVMRYQHLRDSVILIQSTYRGKIAREQLKKQKAVVKLQAATRMYVQRSKFRTLKQSTITVQASIRSWLARRCMARLREEKREERLKHVAKVTKAMRGNIAAIRIQRCYRNHKIMIIAKERLHSILVIQHWMKAKLDRLHYLRDRERVIRLQSHVRVWLAKRDKAARVIQQAARVWLASAEDRNKHRAALKLQTLWRGHCVRNKIKSRRLTLLRKRVKEATASATEDKKLGNRTSSALDFLLKYKQISEVLMALKCLEVSTRLSGVCCERMVETNAVSVLYKLLQCCNRSVPHMEIIVYTISILTNLAKYEKTRPSLYEASGSVDILVELMSIYREKGQIFIKTCTLLGIIGLDSSCKMGILDDKKLVDRLRSIHLLTSRKHKLEENQRVTRARMNASSINATFMVKSPVKKHKIKPDWSLHKDKMSDIENPLKAINFVMGNLGIKAKTK